jgi:hypothetical protein
MSVQSSRNDQRPVREGRQTDRAFVIQFDPVEGARSRLRGRVELVASGEAIRFRCLKELVGFLVDQLRRRTKGER